jgi:hypothetical protein
LTTEPQARQAWLAAVPEVVRQARDRWSLTIEKPFQPAGQKAGCPALAEVARQLAP